MRERERERDMEREKGVEKKRLGTSEEKAEDDTDNIVQCPCGCNEVRQRHHAKLTFLLLTYMLCLYY